MKKINYKSMRIYTLFRSKDLDHEIGQPAIFLNFLGDQSLVWIGTSKQANIHETPFIMRINGIDTYFYNKGIIKVDTKDLVGKYKNHKTNKIIALSNEQQKSLITKFSNLTLQIDPYEEIKLLKSHINLLEAELKQIKERDDYER